MHFVRTRTSLRDPDPLVGELEHLVLGKHTVRVELCCERLGASIVSLTPCMCLL